MPDASDLRDRVAALEATVSQLQSARATVGRRGFLALTGTAAAGLVAGTGIARAVHESANGFQAFALLIGPDSNRPAPGGAFFEDKEGHFVYLDTNMGARRHIEVPADDAWTLLNVQADVVHINSGGRIEGGKSGAIDLETHTLENNETAQLDNTPKPIGFMVIEDVTNVHVALMLIGGSDNVVRIVDDDDAAFSTNEGGNKSNVYYSMTNDRYEIENGTGAGPVEYDVQILRS